MTELNEAQREALLASADKHEEAADDVRAIAESLADDGYNVYGAQLREVVAQMIKHVDSARDLARKP